MFSIFGCGASDNLAAALPPQPHQRQFRSRPIAYPSSAAATPRVSTSSDGLSQAPNAVEPINEGLSSHGSLRATKLICQDNSAELRASASRSMHGMTYPAVARQHPPMLQCYPSPAFAYMSAPPMYHPMPLCQPLMYPHDQQCMDWVLMPSQFPSAQLRMSQARSPEWVSEGELVLPHLPSVTTASTSDASLQASEQTRPRPKEVRRQWTKIQSCQVISAKSEDEPTSEGTRSVPINLPPVEQITSASSLFCTGLSATSQTEVGIGVSEGKLEAPLVQHDSTSINREIFSINEQSLSVESALLQVTSGKAADHEPRPAQDRPLPEMREAQDKPFPETLDRSRPNSRAKDRPRHKVTARLYDSGTDPLSPLHALSYDLKECPCQKCRPEAVNNFSCTLKMWEDRSKKSSPPPTKRKRTDGGRSWRESEGPAHEIKTPQRRAFAESKDAIESANIASSTPNTENESIPTEGRPQAAGNSSLIVQRLAHSVVDENVAPKSNFAEIGRTQSSKSDEVDVALRQALTKLQKGFDLRANFIRMKRGIYAISLDGVDPSVSDRCATAVPRRRSCHVDENFAIMTERTTLTRPFLSQSTQDPGELPDVFCFVSVQMLESARISVRVLDRQEVLKHFGSVALAKWLRPENAGFLPQGSRTRSLSLNRTVSGGGYAEATPLAGKKDTLWKSGAYGRLNDFLHFFRASSIRQRPRLHQPNFAR